MEIIEGFDTDFIPSVTEPAFTTTYFGDGDDELLVIGTEGEPRAYPVPILDLHHMINDEIDGTPVVVTWCPLCGSGVAYERKIDGRTLTFEFAGKLVDNNFVMRDRETGSEWKQSTGNCLSGEFEGNELDLCSVRMTTWDEYSAESPNGTVLERPSARTPYQFYRFEKAMTALLAHPAGRDVADAVSHLVRAANLVRDPESGTTNVNVRPFFRIMQGGIELSDWVFGSAEERVEYDGVPMDIYERSDAFGFPPVHGGHRNWEVSELEDIAAKTRTLGVTLGNEALGFPRPRVEEAGRVVQTTVGGTEIVVFATEEGLDAFEDPGFEFEPSDDGATFEADDAEWSGVTGESDDGRVLTRIPGRFTFAYSWQNDHGAAAFYIRDSVERRTNS
ncbi:DUF3179 domain-containing (seleno)protein [Haladaptatus sp. CMAA 1911]|uniref:DUF3179 domain-containing (seleno)protein n=1 Tax=unclassified Haladaptatus TaxID=2622732 RepID=UPI0037547147